MPDLVPVRRALISVSDKTGLAEFATALAREFDVTLLSTGGTAKFLRDAGLAVTDVAEVTGFPEMMDGRVKTLHPKIHGGLLALRDDPAHVAAMSEHGIEPIDLVCINLYPFAETIAKPGCTFQNAIENIDIGGPSMIRSGAKNHRSVAVVTSAGQYEKVLGDLRQHAGSTCGKHRLKLARAAFAKTAEYDAAIDAYLATHLEDSADESALPAKLTLTLEREQSLRYGENPHQRAAVYATSRVGSSSDETSLLNAIQHHGKELSYINLLDADAALAAVAEFETAAVCIVKHATPCGIAAGRAGAHLAEVFELAYESDPLAAFGGIVAVNRKLDRTTAEKIAAGQKFVEVVVAPGYDADALDLLKQRWKNTRLLEVDRVPPEPARRPLPSDLNLRSIAGGYLVQERDTVGIVDLDWKVVSARQPTPGEMADLRFAWLACKHVKSNAIVLASGGATVGIGGGQVDRVGAARIAIEKASNRRPRFSEAGAPSPAPLVAASDAFFPFPDGPRLLLDAGVTALVHPGGSVRDQESIDLVNERGAAMILTGRRHFRH